MNARVIAAAVASALALLPAAAFAHETQQFRIGDDDYSFVVGSMNEPVAVDDKSGVEVTINRVDNAKPVGVQDEAAPHAYTMVPTMALEQTLKVEVSAGAKKKVFDLRPTYGEPGSYEAVFFPTVQTTFTYRFFGTINDVPVDLSFTCNPAGHPQSEADTSEVTIAENVTRTLKRGAFGCPTAKADLGFPEPAPTLVDLGSSNGPSPMVAIGLSGVALVFSLMAMRKKSTSTI